MKQTLRSFNEVSEHGTPPLLTSMLMFVKLVDMFTARPCTPHVPSLPLDSQGSARAVATLSGSPLLLTVLLLVLGLAKRVVLKRTSQPGERREASMWAEGDCRKYAHTPDQ